MLVVPFGRRRLLGVVVGMADESELPAGAPRRAATRARARGAGRPRAARPLGGREYCSTPARGLGARASAGHGHRQRPPAAPAAAARVELTDAGRALSPEEPAAWAPASTRRFALCAAGPAACGGPGPRDRVLPRLPAWTGQRRGLVELRQARSSAGGRSIDGWARSARPGARALARPAARRCEVVSRGWTPRIARHGCCSTASPAAARPRSTCVRWRRRSSAGGRRSCSCRRSRSRRRRRAASASASATRWRCCTRSWRRGERYDEWCAPARAARRASAWGRARRCSRRSRTSA